MSDEYSAEKYYRLPWMSDDQWFCAEMFARVVGGHHHVVSDFKACGRGIRTSDFASKWATYDSSLLTRLVFIAHDEAVRVELSQSSPGRIGFAMWRRKREPEGNLFARHPTIEEALAKHRERNPIESCA